VRNLGPGDALLTTVMEHHANLVPFTARGAGPRLRGPHVPLTADGQLDLDAARELRGGRAGALRGLRARLERARHDQRRRPADAAWSRTPTTCVVHVDGTQAVPQMPVSFRDLGVDFYALTGHKMCGPTGIGALVARPELLESMAPFLTGGEMIRDVTLLRRHLERHPAQVRGGHAR
jgi:cysteine desulfurase / selenocysteine lyase